MTKVEPLEMKVALVECLVYDKEKDRLDLNEVYPKDLDNERWFDTYDELKNYYHNLRLADYEILRVLTRLVKPERQHYEVTLFLGKPDDI